MITFDNLNENQGRAVGWDDGPVLVLAGPGSGKTGVLTLRVARLLEEDESASVLALTFTNKAATEMRERVDDLLGERAGRAQLCTFHSFATDLLAQHGSHLGIRSDFRHAVRDEDRIALLDDVLDELDEEVPADRRSLLRLIDRLFSESYAGEGESASLASTPGWLPPLYRRYCDALIEANRLDFGSLLSLAARLLREKPAVARVVRLGWTHVCVDEFQDTNRAQYDLLRLIAPARSHSLFVVADDDQIIYQWNGASPQRLQDLRRDYDLQTIQLPESYRCPPAIVSLANRLIGHNTRRIAEKKILAVHDPQVAYAGEVKYDVFASPLEEAEFVGRDIGERGVPSSDCVVLGRTTRLVQDAADQLRSAGYDAYVPVRKSEFDSPAANVLLEALRSANSPHDRVVLRRLCLAWEGLTGVVVDPQSVEAAATLLAARDPGRVGWGAAGGRDDAGGSGRRVPDAEGEGDGLAVGFRGEDGFEGEVAAAGGREVLVVDPYVGEPVGGADDDDGLVAGRRRGDVEPAAVPVEGGAGRWAVEEELRVDGWFDPGVEVDIAQVGRVADAEFPGAVDARAARGCHRLIP